MRYSVSIVAVVFILLIYCNVLADDLSGTYVLKSQGVTVTLNLDQDTQGQLNGTLVSTSGMQYQLEGVLDQGVGVGACYNDQGSVHFEAHPQGNQLLFALIEVDMNNQPDLSRMKKLLFIKQSRNTASGLSGINQGQSSNRRMTGQQNSQPSLIGTWRARTQEGTVNLIFRSQNQLVFNGHEIHYKQVPGKILVIVDNQYEEYPYVLNGGSLCITDPEGYQLCYSKIDRAVDSESMDQSRPEQHASQLERLLLSSVWCSFSFSASSMSSVSGGYTGSSRIRFYPNGTYSLGSRNEGYSDGYGGSVASQRDQGGDGRWKVQNEKLYMTDGAGPLEPVDLSIKYNSNGYPIINAEGIEYSQCE